MYAEGDPDENIARMDSLCRVVRKIGLPRFISQEELLALRSQMLSDIYTDKFPHNAPCEHDVFKGVLLLCSSPLRARSHSASPIPVFEKRKPIAFHAARYTTSTFDPAEFLDILDANLTFSNVRPHILPCFFAHPRFGFGSQHTLSEGILWHIVAPRKADVEAMMRSIRTRTIGEDIKNLMDLCICMERFGDARYFNPGIFEVWRATMHVMHEHELYEGASEMANCKEYSDA